VRELFRVNFLSAWNLTTVRPDWNVMMGPLGSGASNGVWVYDVTRFSRRVPESERLVELHTVVFCRLEGDNQRRCDNHIARLGQRIREPPLLALARESGVVAMRARLSQAGARTMPGRCLDLVAR
jgi:hypothetical protein